MSSSLCIMLSNLFFAVLGAVISVIFAVWYSKNEFKLLKEKERKELRRKLIKAFRFNIDRLAQMEKQLTSQDKREIPDYRLDTESVAHVLFHGRELFDDEQWFDDFNWQRYQLVHINAKVDFLNDLTNLSDISSGSIFVKGGVGHSRYVSLLRHLKTSQKEISELIVKFEEKAQQGVRANAYVCHSS